MGNRVELQGILEAFLNSRNVYYNPPSNLDMEYDAIRYSKVSPDVRHANDKKYKRMNCYELIVISRLPDPEVVEKILELPYSSLGRPYKADNLNHYPITLYF